jgi:antitoxin ParD1/3/4
MIFCIKGATDMAMMRKTITIPDAMEEWVKTQIKNGRYGNDSEYFRDLIRRDQERRLNEEHLRGLIEDSLDSGVSEASVLDIKQRVESRLRDNGKISAHK